MEPPSRLSIDEIREILRQRGYLDRGLNRLLLGRAGSRFAWLASALKAGLLSGAFLTLCLIGLIFAPSDRPVFRGALETLLFAFYLLLMCVLLTTLVELIAVGTARIAASVLPALHASSRLVPWAVGAAWAVATGIYLSFWWHQRGIGGWNLGVRLVMAAIILIMSFGFGRVTSLVTLGSLVRAGSIPARRIPRRSIGVGLALLLILGSAGVAVSWGFRRAAPTGGRADFPVQSRRGRLLWIGIDGLGEELYQAMRRQGRLEALDRLRAQGCGWTFRRPPIEPPGVWVTSATGVPISRHGVTGVESASWPGVRSTLSDSALADPLIRAARLLNPWIPGVAETPVSGLHRKSKMVWEILGERGVPSYIVNWWTTWPADRGPGVRISERTFFRLAAGGEPDREVFPPEEFERLRLDFSRSRERAEPSPDGLSGQEPLRFGVALDAFHLQSILEGWETGHWPLVAGYLNGTDVLAAPESRERGRAAEVVRARALEEHLETLDRTLRRLMEEMGAKDRILVQGDPGRDAGSIGDRGFAVMNGAGIVPNRSLSGNLLDIAPTVLRILGFPVAQDMPGRARTECFEPGGELGETAPPNVPTFGERQLPDLRPSDFDPKVLENLRSLGYIR